MQPCGVQNPVPGAHEVSQTDWKQQVQLGITHAFGADVQAAHIIMHMLDPVEVTVEVTPTVFETLDTVVALFETVVALFETVVTPFVALLALLVDAFDVAFDTLTVAVTLDAVVCPAVTDALPLLDVLAAPPWPPTWQVFWPGLQSVFSVMQAWFSHVSPGPHVTPAHLASSWIGSSKDSCGVNVSERRATRQGITGNVTSGSAKLR